MTDDRTNMPELPELPDTQGQEPGSVEKEAWLREFEAAGAGERASSPLDEIPWLKDMLEEPASDDYRTEDPIRTEMPAEMQAEAPAEAPAEMPAEVPPALPAEPAPQVSAPEVFPAVPAYTVEGGVPAAPVEVEQPPRDRGRFHTNRRSAAERRMERKKVLKTPDYYEGPGKDEPFRINFDFQDEYRSPVRHLPIRRSTVKRTGWAGGLMYFAFVLCISVTVAALLWMAATDVLALGKEEGKVQVVIPEDYTVEDVSEILFSKGLIRYKKLFNLYGTYAHIEDTVDPGTYIVQTNFDYRALVYGLSDGGGEQIIAEVTIPEGCNMDEIVEILESHGICSGDSFMDAAANTVFEYSWLTEETGDPYRLEGYLFPDTYEFYVNDDPERVIEKFLDDFDYRFSEELRLRAEEMGYSVREILSVAAIIEEEAGSNAERADIASVIYNRLSGDGHGLLQMDSTVYYAASREGTEFDTTLDSPYNTYVYAGLPGPITNPGLASIKAALYPNETEYYYFAINTDGISVFFEDYDSFVNFTNSEEYGG